MQQSTPPPGIVPLFDPLHSSYSSRRQQTSIWAPRPLLSDASWPKSLDNFSRRFPERDGIQRSDLVNPGSNSVEDVFGPVGFLDTSRKKSVGAIGDGRKKSSPDLEDTVCYIYIYCFLCPKLTPRSLSMLSNSFAFLI
jgi:pumilio RNA-binding family